MFPCSHENISFLWNEKRRGENKEESCSQKLRFLYFMRSPEVWEHTRAHVLDECPSLSQENALVQKPLLQRDVTHLSSFGWHGIIAGVRGGHGHDECVYILDEWKFPAFGFKNANPICLTLFFLFLIHNGKTNISLFVWSWARVFLAFQFCEY